MFSLFRLTSPSNLLPSHQHPPQKSPLGNSTSGNLVLTDASPSHAGQGTTTEPSPHAISIAKPESTTNNTQHLPPLIHRLPLSDLELNARNNDATNRNTIRYSALSLSSICYPSSLGFPVVGPFDILHRVQVGGFGVTWAAKDRRSGLLLCLKEFRSLREPRAKRSVQTELKMFRRIARSRRGNRGRPFVLELIRSMQQYDTVFFAMELFATDLGAYMYTESKRSTLNACRWIAQIALGIETLHEMGIIHRDIKPENILIDARENVRIIDFGLSYLNPSGLPLLPESGYTNDFVGTMSYMAPEVWRNKDMPFKDRMDYGAAVDWWGLGCILYDLESENHHALFDSGEDVYAYIEWTVGPRKFGQLFPKFEPLRPVVVELLEGLLRLGLLERFTIKDLEGHAYFLHRDGTSDFDNAVDRAMRRPIRPKLMPQYGDDDPVKVVEAAESCTVYDWSNMNFVMTS